MKDPADVNGADVSKPRLLFINRSYWPDVEATGQLLTELCEDLASEFDVTVVCGQPRKVSDDAPADFRRLRERNGVRIRRVWHSMFDKRSFVGRLANMLTFQLFATWSVLTASRPAVVIVETDPPFLCLLGRALQLLRRTRLVCYLQDIYPDIAVALGKLKPGLIARILRSSFFGVYRRCDSVVILSRDMRDLLTSSGVPKERVRIIPNWIDTQLVRPIKEANRFREMHELDCKFIVMYSGNLGLSQNLVQVIDAAERLRTHEDIVFAMVGDGADRINLIRVARDKGLTNLRFFDYQPKSELAMSLSAADVHLVVLQPQIRQLLMPSKFYGALASGTPVIAIAAEDCELSETVRRHDLGNVVSSSNAESLANTILSMKASPSALKIQAEKAREYATQHCTRSASVQRMSLLCREVLGLTTELVPTKVSVEAANV